MLARTLWRHSPHSTNRAGYQLQPSTFAGTVNFGPARESSTNLAPLDLGDPVFITSPQGQAISLYNFSFCNVRLGGTRGPSAFSPPAAYPAGNWLLTTPGSDTLPPSNGNSASTSRSPPTHSPINSNAAPRPVSGRMELRIAGLLKLTGPFRDGTPAIGVHSTEP